MVRVRALNEREFTDGKKTGEIKEKIKQLTEKYNVPAHMGELFLSEIKLSTDKANEHLRQDAKLLGLM